MEGRILSEKDSKRVHSSLVSFDEDSASQRIVSSLQETQATDLFQSSFHGNWSEEHERRGGSMSVLFRKISSASAGFMEVQEKETEEEIWSEVLSEMYP